MKKYYKAVIAMLFLFSPILISICYQQYSNKNEVHTYIDVFYKGTFPKDYDTLSKKEQESIEMAINTTKKQLFLSYFKDSGLPVSKKQYVELTKAYETKVSSLKYKIHVWKNKDCSLRVKIKTQQIPLMELEEKATDAAIKEIKKKNVIRLNQASKIFTKHLVKEINDYRPKRKNGIITITFINKNGSYVPKDMKKMIQQCNVVISDQFLNEIKK